MKKNKEDNIVKFPSNLSSGEREVEAILFAAAEPLEIESIEVIDITGKVIRNMNTGGKFTSLDLSNLVNGAYMIVVHTNNSVSTKRIIKD